MSDLDEREWLGTFEARRIERMLARLFLGRLRPDEELVVSGRRDRDWLAVQFCLARRDRSLVYRVDARVARRSRKLDDESLKNVLLDLLGHLFDGYLAKVREPFTGPNWESIDFDGHVVWLQGQELDERAEAQGRGMLDADAAAFGRELAAAARAAELASHDDGDVDGPDDHPNDTPNDASDHRNEADDSGADEASQDDDERP